MKSRSFRPTSIVLARALLLAFLSAFAASAVASPSDSAPAPHTMLSVGLGYWTSAGRTFDPTGSVAFQVTALFPTYSDWLYTGPFLGGGFVRAFMSNGSHTTKLAVPVGIASEVRRPLSPQSTIYLSPTLGFCPTFQKRSQGQEVFGGVTLASGIGVGLETMRGNRNLAVEIRYQSLDAVPWVAWPTYRADLISLQLVTHLR